MSHGTATATTSEIPTKRLPGRILGLAFTEFWERFSFYGLNGILTFYLLFTVNDGGLEIAPAAAAGIVGAYGGAVYLAQLAGAWLGERVLSPKWLVFWGGVVITAGHLALAVLPGISGLAAGLVLIVFGTGALKTNITNIVGFALAGKDEGHRDVGFAYFYLAINVGAVVGPLSTGFAQNAWGFHWGFGLAAVGMVVALVQYVFSMPNLPARAGLVARPIVGNRLTGIAALAVAVGVAVTLCIVNGIVRPEQLAVIATVLSLAAAAWYFIMMLSAKNVTRDEKRRITAYLPLFLAASIYFGLLFQQFTTIAILISERVDLHLGQWSIPVAWITMLSQLAAVVVTPFVAYFWGRAGKNSPGAPSKFALGLVQIGAAYVIMLLVLRFYSDALVPLLLVVVVMVVAGSSEVFIGPVSLSLATRIGPAKYESQLVGLNFLTLALGSSFSGLFGQLFTLMDEGSYFMLIIGLGVASGVLLWLFKAPLQRSLYAGL